MLSGGSEHGEGEGLPEMSLGGWMEFSIEQNKSWGVGAKVIPILCN